MPSDACTLLHANPSVKSSIVLDMGREQDQAAALSVIIDHLAERLSRAAWVVLIDGAIRSHLSGGGNGFVQVALVRAFPFRRATIITSGLSAAYSCQDPIVQLHNPKE